MSKGDYDQGQVEATLAKARARHPQLFDKVEPAPPKTGQGLQTRIDQMGVARKEYDQQKRVRNDQEHREQCAIVNHIKQRLRPNVFWFAVPNGGDRPTKLNKKTGKRWSPEGARLKKEGVRAGVPDLHFLVGGQACVNCGEDAPGLPLYIEYKPLGKYLSPVQKDMRDEIEQAGGVWFVAQGIDAALLILEQYGVIWPDKAQRKQQDTNDL